MTQLPIPDPVEIEDEPEIKLPPNRSQLIQWLVVLSLGILFLPLYFVSATIRDNTAPLNTQVANIVSTLSVSPGPSDAEMALQSTLVQLQHQAVALNTVVPTLSTNRINWPAAMAVIGNYDQTHIVLIGIVQTDKVITISGQATDENIVVAYAQMLKDSHQFSHVAIEGITIKPSPTPSPTPTLTMTPTSLPTTAADATPKATATATNMPTATPPGPNDDLRDKFAGFTIVLEANAPVVSPTPGPS